MNEYYTVVSIVNRSNHEIVNQYIVTDVGSIIPLPKKSVEQSSEDIMMEFTNMLEKLPQAPDVEYGDGND